MMKHNIPFKKNTIVYFVMLGSLQGGKEGGWSDLSIKEIAEVLDTSYGAVNNAIRSIRTKTGYAVPHVSGWKAREREEYGEW